MKKLKTIAFWILLGATASLYGTILISQGLPQQRNNKIQKLKPPRTAETFSVTVTMTYDDVTLEEAAEMERKLLVYFTTATDIDVRIANIITPDELRKGYGWEAMPDGTLVFPNMDLHPLYDSADSTMVIPKSLKPEFVTPGDKI